jgi:hypothetical protein
MKGGAASILVGLAIVVGLPAATGNAGPVDHKAIGAGKDHAGLKFDFKAKLKNGVPQGHVFFETFSFGDPEGDVVCISVDRRLAFLSGPITSTPVSGLDEFLLVLRDRRRDGKGKRDEFAAWMSNLPYDCSDPLVQDDHRTEEPIKKGDISIE